MIKYSFKVDSGTQAECRSCLGMKNIEDMKGRLCTNCIQTAGKFLRDTDKELLKNLTEIDISNRVCI